MKKLILMFLVVMVLPFISSSQPFTYDNLKIGNRLDVTVGGQIITAAKGDLITDDGTSTTALSVGSNGQVLITNSAESTGLEWRDLVMYDITDFATAHGNATTGIHGVGAGAIVSTSTTQTLTNKTISGSTNTIGANELRTTGASVVIDGFLSTIDKSNIDGYFFNLSIMADTKFSWYGISSASLPT